MRLVAIVVFVCACETSPRTPTVSAPVSSEQPPSSAAPPSPLPSVQPRPSAAPSLDGGPYKTGMCGIGKTWAYEQGCDPPPEPKCVIVGGPATRWHCGCDGQSRASNNAPWRFKGACKPEEER